MIQDEIFIHKNVEQNHQRFIHKIMKMTHNWWKYRLCQKSRVTYLTIWTKLHSFTENIECHQWIQWTHYHAKGRHVSANLLQLQSEWVFEPERIKEWSVMDCTQSVRTDKGEGWNIYLDENYCNNILLYEVQHTVTKKHSV